MSGFNFPIRRTGRGRKSGLKGHHADLVLPQNRMDTGEQNRERNDHDVRKEGKSNLLGGDSTVCIDDDVGGRAAPGGRGV